MLAIIYIVTLDFRSHDLRSEISAVKTTKWDCCMTTEVTPHDPLIPSHVRLPLPQKLRKGVDTGTQVAPVRAEG